MRSWTLEPEGDIVTIIGPPLNPRERAVAVCDVLPEHYVDAQAIRDLTDTTSRHTLIKWRRDPKFPHPLVTLGHGPSMTELWDVREVQRWLNQRRSRTASR